MSNQNIESLKVTNNTGMSSDIVFQVISWFANDIDTYDENNSKIYRIQLFGTTEMGKSVSVTIDNFTPHYYICVPDNWNTMHKKYFEDWLKKKSNYIKNSLIRTDMLSRKKLFGFTNKKNFKFIRLVFNSCICMKYTAKLFRQPIYIPKLTSGKYKFDTYESKIEPMLRFIHIKKIKACGWVKIPAGKYKILSNNSYLSDINISMKWNFIESIEINKIAPIKIAAYDIEASSSDFTYSKGQKNYDFPQPNKDYRKLAMDINEYITVDTRITKALIQRILYYSFGFIDLEIFKLAINRMNTFGNPSKKVLNSLAEPIIKILNNKNIDRIDALRKLFNSAELPKVKGDKVIQIGTTINKYGENNLYLKHIITLGTCDPIDGVIVESYDTEEEVLLAWTKLIQNQNPEILTGYNIFGFDYKYLYLRAKELGIERQFSKFNINRNESSKFTTKVLQSAALGHNELKYYDMIGRINFDIFKIIQRDYKLNSYKLDNVANHFIGQKKDDVSPQDIFKLQLGNSADRAKVAKYCVQDCALCNRLINKLQIVTNNISMANVCFVPLSYIFLRGQGIKTLSIVSRRCRTDEYLIKDIQVKNADGYEGAIVLPPKPGIYLETPVSVLDYASLYPSSMISENLSHETYVTDPKYLGDDGKKLLEELGYGTEDITYDLYKTEKNKRFKIGQKTCRFVQYPNDEKGIIPNVLMDLLKTRKETKKLMKAEKDPFKKNLYDGLQQAYKVSANSIYGQIGATTSAVCCKEIAASTTATGRKLLTWAGEFATQNYKSKKFNDILIKDTKLVYGDSVVANTPLLLRNIDGDICIKTIEDLSNDWKSYEEFKPWDTNRTDKQQSITNYEVWSDNKWSKIKRVIRHKTIKKIYRINTHTGCVDVTEDHSLLDENKNILKPNNCNISETKLFQCYPDSVSKSNKNYPIISFSGMLHINKNNKYYILGTICAQELDYFPEDILNSTFQKKYNFFVGYYHQNKLEYSQDKIKLYCVNKLHSAKLYYLCKSLGYYVKLDYYQNQFIFTCYFVKQKNTNVVKKIIDLGYSEDYVYDLETEVGIFQAGIGEIIVKNTDSIFVSYDMVNKHGDKITGKDALKASIDISVDIEKNFKKLLKAPHNLEYEKTFYPFVLLSKKRYVGNLYEFDIEKFKQKSMGIVLKRRDNANIVKIIYGGIIDIILNQKDINKSILFLKKSLIDLVNGKYPIEDLIVSKTIRAKYKNPESIAHKVLSMRMGKRDPGNKPKSNDRIPYVYIQLDTEAVLNAKWKGIDRCTYQFVKSYNAEKMLNCMLKYFKNMNKVQLIGDVELEKGCTDILDENNKFSSVTFKRFVTMLVEYCLGQNKLEYEEVNKIVKKKLKTRVRIIQGDKIEHPDFIKENKLKPDYKFYITNQLMKPICQIYDLVLDDSKIFFQDALKY